MKFDIITILIAQALARGVSAGVTRINRIQEVLRSYQESWKRGQSSVGRPRNTTNALVPVAPGRFKQKRETLVNDVRSMGFLNRIFLEDNDMCTHENENLSLLFSSNLDPFWFYYEENVLMKDFSPHFQCTDGSPDYFSCDYIDMLEYSVGPCQFMGGTMYSVSFNQTCSDDGEDYDLHNDTNLPICLGSSCVFNETSIEDDVNFDICSGPEASFEAEIVKMESLASDMCLAEVQNIRETTGLQDPDFIFNLEDVNVFALYCNIEVASDGTFVDDCDFTPLLKDYREPCEDGGGVLYKFSDMLNFTEGYYGTAPYEGIYKNIPLCIGASCDAENYFEKYVFPYHSFSMEGDFYEDQHDDTEPSKFTYHYSGTYTPIEYAPVLKTENPHSSFLFKSHLAEDGKQVDKIRKCWWLATRQENVKEIICSRWRFQIYSEQSGVGPASLTCPETCASYCHMEREDAEFVYKIHETKGLLTKKCKWLQMQDQDVIASVCDTKVDVGGETIYGGAADTCTETCGSC